MDNLKRKTRNLFNKKGNESNIFSTILFCWIIPLLVKGLKKGVNDKDFLKLPKDQESRTIAKKLKKSWKKEIASYKHPSLWRAFCRVFVLHFLGVSLLYFVKELSRLVQTLALGQLMLFYMGKDDTITKNQAYIYAGAISGLSVFCSLLTHNFLLRLTFLAMRLKVSASALIYRKSLRLSQNSLREYTTGKIANLLSNDVSRLETGVNHFQAIFFAPLIVGIKLYVMYVYVGLTACVGVGSFLLYLPLQMYCARKICFYREHAALKTDERVRFMNEIISGIKVIKMYTWEKPFAEIVAKFRNLEMKQIRGANYIKGGILSLSFFAGHFAVYFCILAYILTGNALNAYYFYVISSMYKAMRMVMTQHLPKGMAELGEMNVAIKRIQKMLLAEEIDENFKEMYKPKNGSFKLDIETKGAVGISMKGVGAKWFLDSSENTLSGVDFTAQGKQLLAIIGSTGSGKTSLLQTILKELHVTEGTIDLRGSFSYASQESWIFPGTVRQNILFGQAMNPKRYQEVVKVCALEHDLKMFPFGDNTIVGERGVLLSGGQKSRINLARAVYKNADLYLLDDPLSAVDAHVGSQLFEQCIKGFLKEKCVVLVTHQLQYLRKVHNIVVMEKGKIVTEGTFKTLFQEGHFGSSVLNNADLNKREDTGIKCVNVVSDKIDKSAVDEHMSHGGIHSKVYNAYVDAAGGYCTFMVIIALFIISQVFGNAADYFTTFWVNLEQNRSQINTNIERNWTDFFTSYNCLYIYTALTLAMIGTGLLRSLSFYGLCLKASKNLHSTVFSKIILSSMYFFNTNPSGRILNRFSKDMGIIDEALPISLADALQLALNCLGAVLLTVIANYWLILPVIVLSFVAYIFYSVYMETSHSIKRIEGVTKSPILTHQNTTLKGVSTIRALGAQKQVINEFDIYQDIHTTAYYNFISCSRTFGFWIDAVLNIYVIIVTYSFLVFQNDTSYAGNVGLAISQALGLTGMVQFGLKQWSDFENYMTSVERVVEYTDLETEKVEDGKVPDPSWPDKGNVEFKSVWMRYSQKDLYVLKNLSLVIKSKEKVGIIGRTGAGKSSLISALFLLNSIEGDILIDKINTKDIQLGHLRCKISIIPQEPVLFSGTLRSNLDPFDEYSDQELWKALEEVELKQTIARLPQSLEHQMSEGGSNFSVGQRQLLCLARALIRKNKILVMDEATASVDNKTDELIQKTIRRNFADCTVLTIAHRLHTIMDSDKILALDGGRIVEFGHPHELLQKKGMFYDLVQQMGSEMSKNLFSTAEEKFGIFKTSL